MINGHSSGQVMIFVVMALGGLLFAATTIAGLLMIYQVRQASDIKSSTKAVYAADAAIEWANYQIVVATTTPTEFSSSTSFGSSTVHSAGLCYSMIPNSSPIECRPYFWGITCPSSTFIVQGFGRVGNAFRTFAQVPTSTSGCTW